MHYVTVENLSKTYADKALFENITFHIQEGDKIALVALNGSGKSTLLKILAGQEVPDTGKVLIHKDVTVVLLDQSPSLDEEKTVIENILNHPHPAIQAISRYELLTEKENPEPYETEEAIRAMDEADAWGFDTAIKQVLGKLNIHHLDQQVAQLSGGQKKRIALAKVLIDMDFEHRHTLLIMDEPTNHLDVEMIEWLEHYLTQDKVTLLLVTHDRYFLDSVCTEILELDNKKVYSSKGGYDRYLEQKAIRYENEQANIDKAKNLYRKELEWMRRQPKARTTKSKSRENAFYEVETKAKKKIEDQSLELQVKMTRLGGKILELKKLYKSYGDKLIVNKFDYTFKKGERIGIIGKNGVGKSTFINMLLGKELPNNGKINVGETVVFGDFSQEGLQIKEDLRVIEFVKNIAEFFPLADGTKISATQFLQKFLFSPEKQYTHISKLSGGEKKRLQLLSILFRNPNFLVLDEPTNDLDLPTLDILEQFLLEYTGCIIIVSHDRYFMDKIVDHLFVFEGNGIISDYPGNYSQYRIAEAEKKKQAAESAKLEKNIKNLPTINSNISKTKLSYKEKRELEVLNKEIPKLEEEKKQLEITMSEGNLNFENLQKTGNRIVEIAHLLDEMELRWLELGERDE